MSLNHTNFHKISNDEEKNKVNSSIEINLTNLKQSDSHLVESIHLYNKDSAHISNNTHQRILINNFTDFINIKEKRLSKNIDLSIISEKDDNNTSISYMEQIKENKIKDFIVSAINDIKSISCDKNIKKSISQENLDNSMKMSFLKNKRNINSADKLVLEEELKRNISNNHDHRYSDYAFSMRMGQNSNKNKILIEVDSPRNVMDDCINDDHKIVVSGINQKLNEDHFSQNYSNRAYDNEKIKLDHLSSDSNLNSDFADIPVVRKNSEHLDEIDGFNKSEYKCKNNHDDSKEIIKEEKYILTRDIIEKNEKELDTYLHSKYLNDDHIAFPINSKEDKQTNVKTLDCYKQLKTDNSKDRNVRQDNSNTIDMDYIELNGINNEISSCKDLKKIDDKKNKFSVRSDSHILPPFTNIFEKYKLCILFSMQQYPLLFDLIKKFK